MLAAAPIAEGADVRRVLIHRQGSLGDTVMALPSLHVVRRAFPMAERRLLTNIAVSRVAAPALDLLKPAGLVHAAIAYPVGTRSPRAVARLQAQIRAWRPDVAVYLVEARSAGQHLRDMLLMRLSGVRRLVGYDQSGALSEYRETGPGGIRESEAQRLLRAVAELGSIDLETRAAWDLELTPQERRAATSALGSLGATGGLIAFSVGTKAQANDYGDENWGHVLRSLGWGHPDQALVAVGAPSEAGRTDALLRSWPGRALNLCGRLSVRESAAVLEQATVFIGHDSGPMHLASAMGTPCVAVFSARNPKGIWFPNGRHHAVLYTATSCSPCGLTTCERERKRCILSIAPDAVVAACAAAIQRASSGTRVSMCT